jgi:hypothetical protein
MLTIALSVISTIIMNLNTKNTNGCLNEVTGLTRSIFFVWLPRLLRIKSPTTFSVPDYSKINIENVNVKKIVPATLFNSVPICLSEQDIILQWKFVAYIVDRICLLVSITLTMISAFLMVVFS